MKTDKLGENKYIILGILLLPIIVFSSLLVQFNVVDALFLLSLIIAGVRYYIIMKNS